MSVINVKSQKWNSKPGHQLLIIRDFLLSTDESGMDLDFSEFHYGPPLLAVYFTRLVKDYKQYRVSNRPSAPYLNIIKFLEGFHPGSVPNWAQYLGTFQDKSYLPVIKFTTGKSKDTTLIRDNLISHVGKMIRQITGIPMNYYMAVNYLLSELTDNIVDHSGHDNGWLSFQYYPSEGFMDICLSDSGVGILGSYRNYEGEKDYSSVRNHLDAVETMVKGGSTKSLKERGFGVHTSREMLIDGLNGIFIFLSGNALLINYDLFDFKVNSPGTLAFLRIPVVNQKENFNIYNYTE